MVRKRTAGRLLVAVAALTLVAACGSEDSGTDDGTLTLRTLTVSQSTGSADFWVAHGAGYFEDEGITIQIDGEIANTGTIVESLAKGDADLAVTSQSAVFYAHENDRDIKMVASGADPQVGPVVAATKFLEEQEAEGVTPDSPLEDRLQALEGATIGLGQRGPGTEANFRAMFDDLGIEYGEDTFIALGGVPAIDAGLKASRVDVAISALPVALQPSKGGYGELWLKPEDYQHIPSWNVGNTVVIASTEWAEAHQGEIDKIHAALEKARKLIVDEPDEAVDAFLESAPENDRELLQEAFTLITENFGGDPTISEDFFERSKRVYDIGSGQESSDLTYAEGVWTK